MTDQESLHHQNVNGHGTNKYQTLCDRVKNMIKKNTTMEFYNENEQLHLETDAFSVGLAATLMQVRDGMHSPRSKAPNKQHCGQWYL